MAATVNLPPNNSTDADFRSWGSGVCAQLESMGILKTADTGQINWATVTRPTVAGAFQGYEIRQFSDPLQATKPVFIKLEFGGSTNSANSPAMAITMGTGSNGAGTLTGAVTTRYVFSGNNSGSSTTYPCRFIGGTNRFAFFLFYGYTNANLWLAVERSHNADGTDNSAGAMFYTGGNLGGANAGYIDFDRNLAYSWAHWNMTPPPTGTGAVASDIFLYPVRAWGPWETSASVQFFGYFGVDLTAGIEVSASTWWGGTVNVWPSNVSNTAMYYGGACNVAMRYD